MSDSDTSMFNVINRRIMDQSWAGTYVFASSRIQRNAMGEDPPVLEKTSRQNMLDVTEAKFSVF